MRWLFCLCLLLPDLAAAAVYKCVDHGQVTYSATPCGEHAQVLSSRSEVAEQPSQGTLTLYLGANRTYRVQGTINGYPMEFIVDTGASQTAISQRVASVAGIRTCTGLGHLNTAGGIVRKCVATVPKMSFGMFHVDNLIVTILPNLGVDALLGMDVLRKMKVEQRGDVMYISN